MAVLHGFTQRGQMFGELAALLECGVWAPDLPGHGEQPPAPDWDGAVDLVAGAIRSVAPLPLMGYSQGGRIALGIAASHPELVSHLVLVSTSPGLRDPEQRAERRRRDHQLADHIEQVGTDRFIAEWVSLTMFEGVQQLGTDWIDRDRALRRTNGSQGLASALRAYGSGSMPYLGDALKEVACPVTVIVGGADKSYRQGSFEMASAAHASLHVIGGAGHAVAAEAPYQLADVLRNVIEV